MEVVKNFLTVQDFKYLLQDDTWLKYFKINTINNLHAQHLWEYSTEEPGKLAAKTCRTFLKKGGRIRVAVPDGFHSDPKYISFVKLG